MSKQFENPTTYEVTLADAQQWVKDYQKDKPASAAKAFLIDVEELNQIINLSDQVKYVRVYFGMDYNFEEHPEKLLLVPVDVKGIDMINTTGPSQIYDFITPCPPTCDYNSPINPKP